MAAAFWGPWTQSVAQERAAGGSGRSVPLPRLSHDCAQQGPGSLDPDLRNYFLAQALTCCTAVGLLGGQWAGLTPVSVATPDPNPG